MRAGQTLMMVFPGDTQPTPVPRELAAKAREAGAKWHGPNMAPAQPTAMDRIGGVAQRGVNALPDVGGMVGGFMGFTPHQRAANAARLGVAGRATSHVINSITGAEPSWTPQEAATNLGAEAARQAAMGYSGELLAKGGKMLAEPVMKSAIGKAGVGMAKKALRYGLNTSEEYLAGVTKRIADAKIKALGIAADLEKQGHTSTYEALAAPLKRAFARYAKHDVTGSESERALQAVMAEMKAKIGPDVTVTPASTLTDVSGRPLREAFSTTTPAEPLTPTQLQEINQIAGQKLKDLFAAKQGKIGVPPDPRELAYMKVWSRSKQLLEGMGGAQGREISALNKEMQTLYKIHATATRAAERAAPITSGLEAASGAAIAAGGLASDHPSAALFAIPAMFGRSLLMRPHALAAEARFLNSPGFEAGARIVPRIPVALANQLMQKEQ
jgi:hypothetical protein